MIYEGTEDVREGLLGEHREGWLRKDEPESMRAYTYTRHKIIAFILAVQVLDKGLWTEEHKTNP